MEEEIKKKSPWKTIGKFILIVIVFGIIYLVFIAPNEEITGNVVKTDTDLMKNKITYVTYDFSGKNQDGSYFENSISGSGVVFFSNDSLMEIFTNRHVVDCSYTDNCYQRLNEHIKIRTYDGKVYDVSKVLIAPHGLDIAVLEVKTPLSSQYTPALVRKSELELGEKVTAIGYPALSGINNVLELSISDGTITNFRDLLMRDGFAFKAIDSDAYTNHGSSGGGLFDSEGNLVGINTWIQGTKNSIAININVIDDFQSYIYCNSNSYPLGDKSCVQYCEREEVLGDDGLCYPVCKDFYCESQKFNVEDSRCSDGLIAGSDGYCHQPCESPSTYCSGNNLCYHNKCVSCPDVRTKLFSDGTCRFYE